MKDGRSIDWRWGSLIPLSADDGVYGDQNKSVKKARDDAKGKSAEIFSCSGRLEASLILFFLSFHQLSFLFPTLFLFYLKFYIQIGSQKVRISALLFVECLVSSLCAYLAQFCRNCCGIAFQRMVRWTGTRWGAGRSDWRFSSSWASF